MLTRTSTDITIDWHENQIPHFVEGELNRLYGTMYSSIAWLRVNCTPPNVHTYVARRGNEAIAVLLCLHHGARIRVITEGIELDADEVQRFTEFIFEKFNGIQAVILTAVTADTRLVKRPRQQFFFQKTSS